MVKEDEDATSNTDHLSPEELALTSLSLTHYNTLTSPFVTVSVWQLAASQRLPWLSSDSAPKRCLLCILDRRALLPSRAALARRGIIVV